MFVNDNQFKTATGYVQITTTESCRRDLLRGHSKITKPENKA